MVFVNCPMFLVERVDWSVLFYFFAIITGFRCSPFQKHLCKVGNADITGVCCSCLGHIVAVGTSWRIISWNCRFSSESTGTTNLVDID